MLRTNSKKARENIRAYILENFTPEVYEPEFWQTVEKYRKNSFYKLDKFSIAAHFIIYHFHNEKYNTKEDKYFYRNNEFTAFVDWCSGLPSLLDTCYYYNRSAIDDLSAILEQDDATKSKYDERDAEKLLTTLIYRELKKAVEK